MRDEYGHACHATLRALVTTLDLESLMVLIEDACELERIYADTPKEKAYWSRRQELMAKICQDVCDAMAHWYELEQPPVEDEEHIPC